MSLPTELVGPVQPLYERLGLRPTRLVEATKTVNIRKLRHVHPETGVESVWFNASDLIDLLDREFEVTESQHVGRLADIAKRLAGRA